MKYGTIAVALVLVGTLGCTRHVSRGVSAQGEASGLVFPGQDTLVLKQGTFPTQEAVDQIGPGVTKDQLYRLLGRPHYREGFRAREWDYLFHIRSGDQVRTCQYKVTFDAHYRGQHFYWSPADCANAIKNVAPEPRPIVKRFSLSSDVLFSFGGYRPTDMLPEGQEALMNVATQIKQVPGAKALVVGHADRIGSDHANQRLSEQRAESVRDLLVDQGIPVDGISLEGAGERQPVKSCAATLSHRDLVACLQPNRRVDVTVHGGQ